jgi:hypothetical protein
MSHELFYTSAPRGLRRGSNGYCTVAATRGLPPLLGQQLERLSDYRPPADGPDASPVVLSHLRVNVPGKTYSVLSRICPAGVDHTHRAIFFAHHVALEPAELPPAGPAWLLGQPGFLQTRWDGQVRELPSGRQPPRGLSPPAVCRAWQKAAGDAGWAGVLAEGFLDHPDRVVYLLYPPSVEPLPLLVEALALLPSDQRWRVTFSTVCLAAPQDAACAWRFLPRETAEARKVRGSPGALVLDLGAPLGPAQGGALAATARTGKVPVAAAFPAAPGPASAPLPRLTAPPAGSWMSGGDPTPSPPPTTELPPPPEPEAVAPEPAAAPGASRLPFVLGLLAGLLLAGLASAAGLYLVKQGHDRELQAEKTKHQEELQTAEGKARKSGGEKDRALEAEQRRAQALETELTQVKAQAAAADALKGEVNNLKSDLSVKVGELALEKRTRETAQEALKNRDAALQLIYDVLFDKSYQTNEPGKPLKDRFAALRKGAAVEPGPWKQDLGKWMDYETNALANAQADLATLDKQLAWLDANKKYRTDPFKKFGYEREYDDAKKRLDALKQKPGSVLVARLLESFQKALDDLSPKGK